MLKFLIWVAIFAGVVIGIARATAIRWWRVPSDDPYLSASLSPTLRAGDLILLWRLTKPAYGDLVLCPEPKKDRVTVGRLVGEANDEIKVDGSTITLNGKRQQTESSCAERKFSETDPGTGIEAEMFCEVEVLGESTHLRGNADGHVVKAAEVSSTVPAGHVWLVSDNRLFPWDSRDFGPVPRETCTEMVFYRLTGASGFFDSTRRNQYIR